MEVSGGEGGEPLLGPVFKGIERPGAEGPWKWILTGRMLDSLASLGSSALPPTPRGRRSLSAGSVYEETLDGVSTQEWPVQVSGEQESCGLLQPL